MQTPTKETTLKAIIKAYREKAVAVVILPNATDSLRAKKAIRAFGPVTSAKNRKGETLYGYESTVERLQVMQYVTKLIRDPKTDPNKAKSKTITAARKKQIEQAIVKAYQDGAQIILGFPLSANEQDAREKLKYFGSPTKETLRDGRKSLKVDDIRRQIKAIAIYKIN